MILYHFTSLYNLRNAGPDAILAAGLKPGANSMKDYQEIVLDRGGALLPDAVWFTTDPDANLHAAQRGEHMASYDEVRIKVVIPSTDKRLHYWPVVLRKRGIDVKKMKATTDAPYVPHMMAFYVYIGTVPVSMIREVDYADPVRRTASS